MKDGSDGESHPFKLKVVPLGLDTDGEEESSCVIEHVENAPPIAGSAKQRPVGRHQTLMLDMLRTMAPSGTVNYEDLVEGYLAKLPAADAKQRRDNKSHGKRALEELIAKRLAHMHGDDRVSLTSLVTSGNEGWLE